MTSSTVLQIQDLTFSYGDGPKLFDGLNLALNAGGQIMCMLGPSGVGKSTLLQIVLGGVRPSSGTIAVGAQPLPVFQQFERMILPWFTARKNIVWGCEPVSSATVDRIARILEIGDCLERLPKHLSGGQRQRIVIARAIARSPELLLLDEPFSNLDAGTLERVLGPLRTYLKEQGSSALWISHNLIEAVSVADVLCIFGRHGNLRQLPVEAGCDRGLLLEQIQTILSS